MGDGIAENLWLIGANATTDGLLDRLRNLHCVQNPVPGEDAGKKDEERGSYEGGCRENRFSHPSCEG